MSLRLRKRRARAFSLDDDLFQTVETLSQDTEKLSTLFPSPPAVQVDSRGLTPQNYAELQAIASRPDLRGDDLIHYVLKAAHLKAQTASYIRHAIKGNRRAPVTVVNLSRLVEFLIKKGLDAISEPASGSRRNVSKVAQ